MLLCCQVQSGRHWNVVAFPLKCGGGEGNFMQCGSHIMRKRGRSNEPDSGVDVTSLAGPAYDRELDVALMLGRSHGSPRYP